MSGMGYLTLLEAAENALSAAMVLVREARFSSCNSSLEDAHATLCAHIENLKEDANEAR